MSGRVPRLRMFAGPNGSGKSTLRPVLLPELLGVYVNPDQIEDQIRLSGRFDPAGYGVQAGAAEVVEFFRVSPLLEKAGVRERLGKLAESGGGVEFGGMEVDSYVASAAADFLRQKLLQHKATFTVETVMSSPDKVELLRKARAAGYRTYLYYLATNDPEINLARIKARVAQGGHDVPPDKVISRYHRSLDLLLPAIRNTDRAYVFDNSGHLQDRIWIAEVTGGATLEVKTEKVPSWFKHAVLDKIVPGG